MGANDARGQLKVAIAENIRLEAENARLVAELASEREYTAQRRTLDLYAVFLIDALGGIDECDRVVAEGKRTVQADALDAAANRVEDECAHHTGECYCTSSGWLRQRADAIREGQA